MSDVALWAGRGVPEAVARASKVAGIEQTYRIFKVQ